MLQHANNKKKLINNKYEQESEYNDYIPHFDDSDLPDPRIVDDENSQIEYRFRNYPNPDW